MMACAGSGHSGTAASAVGFFPFSAVGDRGRLHHQRGRARCRFENRHPQRFDRSELDFEALALS